MRVITWFSVGIAVATVGIFVGREIAQPLQVQAAHSL